MSSEPKVLRYTDPVRNTKGEWVIKIFWPEEDLKNYIKILYPPRQYPDFVFDWSEMSIPQIQYDDWEAFQQVAITLGYELKKSHWH